ncbi:MAG: helix-turn-helix domain-containing protein [Lachnospiraceae bacterium]
MQNDTLIAIGKRIAQIRRSHKITQEALADMLEVSPKHISHVENATSSFSLRNLLEFCNIFHCSLDYIMFGKEQNEALSKLPEGIVRILNAGSEEDVEQLNRYLDIYLELKEEKRRNE